MQNVASELMRLHVEKAERLTLYGRKPKTLEIRRRVVVLVSKRPATPSELVQALRQSRHDVTRQALNRMLSRLVDLRIVERKATGAFNGPHEIQSYKLKTGLDPETVVIY